MGSTIDAAHLDRARRAHVQSVLIHVVEFLTAHDVGNQNKHNFVLFMLDVGLPK